MYRVMIAAITGNTNWDFDSLQIPGFKLGQDWKAFGIDVQESEPVSGQKVVDLALEHDVLVLQHWPPGSFVQALKKAGVKKVLLWSDSDAMPATRYWSPVQSRMWQTVLMFRVVGTKHNRYGHQMVDVYEAEPNGPLGKPHAWAVDVGAPRFASLFVEALGVTWDSAGYRGVVDGIWFDDMLPAPYYGSASNAPKITESWAQRYVHGQKTMLQTVRKIGFGEVWGNCAALVHHYPELDGKWDELAFVGRALETPAGKIKTSMESAAGAGNADQHYLLNVEGPGTDSFALNEADKWSTTWSRVKTDYAGRVGCVTARTSKWLFVPPPCAETKGTTGGTKTLGKPAEDQVP